VGHARRDAPRAVAAKHGVETVIEGRFQMDVVEALSTQPLLMCARPARPLEYTIPCIQCAYEAPHSVTDLDECLPIGTPAAAFTPSLPHSETNPNQ
jgi:hypothetical protein